jgi:hypothetical protein
MTAILLALPACSASAPALTDDDRAEIYAAVARRLYTVDHTFGDNAPSFPAVYLEGSADERVRESVVAALADLPAEFVWIDSRSEISIDGTTGLVDGGDAAIFTLGDIHPQEDGTVQVEGSLYFANLGAGGRTYILERVDGEWRVTGDTGVIWIS